MSDAQHPDDIPWEQVFTRKLKDDVLTVSCADTIEGPFMRWHSDRRGETFLPVEEFEALAPFIPHVAKKVEEWGRDRTLHRGKSVTETIEAVEVG